MSTKKYITRFNTKNTKTNSKQVDNKPKSQATVDKSAGSSSGGGGGNASKKPSVKTAKRVSPTTTASSKASQSTNSGHGLIRGAVRNANVNNRHEIDGTIASRYGQKHKDGEVASNAEFGIGNIEIDNFNAERENLIQKSNVAKVVSSSQKETEKNVQISRDESVSIEP